MGRTLVEFSEGSNALLPKMDLWLYLISVNKLTIVSEWYIHACLIQGPGFMVTTAAHPADGLYYGSRRIRLARAAYTVGIFAEEWCPSRSQLEKIERAVDILAYAKELGMNELS